AFRACLRGYQLHADNVGSPLFHLVKIFSQFHTAAFAAATGMNLGLHYYPIRVVVFFQLFGRFHSRLGCLCDNAFLHPYAETLQYLLTLIFVNVHLREIWRKSRVLIGNGQGKPPKIAYLRSMLQATGIYKSYGTLPILKGVDLHVAKGEIVSLVGASGAGKSTLLHIIGTLDRPDRGKVMINGTDVGSLQAKQLSAFRNEHIGFVFQF